MKVTIQQIQEIETEMLKEIDRICTENQLAYYLNCGSVLGAVRHQGPIPWDHDADIGVPVNEIDRFIQLMRKNLPSKYYVDYYDVNSRYRPLFPRIGLTGYKTDKLHVDVFKLVGIPSERSSQILFSKRATFLKKMHTYKVKVPSSSLKGALRDYGMKFLLLPFSIQGTIKRFENYCNKYHFESTHFMMNPCGRYGIKNALSKNIFGEGVRVPYNGTMLLIPSQYDEYLRHYYGEYMVWPEESKRRYPDYFEIDEQEIL